MFSSSHWFVDCKMWNLCLFQLFSHPIVYSDTGLEHINDTEYDTVFVLDNFEGDIFARLQKKGCRILGPPAIVYCSKYKQVGSWKCDNV